MRDRGPPHARARLARVCVRAMHGSRTDAAGCRVPLQVPMPVQYKGLRLDCAFKADVVVYDSIIVELKSVETLTALKEAQGLTSIPMARARTGLLINFNVKRLVEGIRRFRR